jgi:hypothetical protein
MIEKLTAFKTSLTEIQPMLVSFEANYHLSAATTNLSNLKGFQDEIERNHHLFPVVLKALRYVMWHEVKELNSQTNLSSKENHQVLLKLNKLFLEFKTFAEENGYNDQ